MNSIKGQQITRISTINSTYANQCINVYDDKGNHYLMKIQEFLAIQNGFNDTVFKIVKKTKHNYLEVKA